MNEHKQDYEQRKAEILSYLEETAAFLSQHNPEDAESLMKMRKNVEDGLFSIVLVGEFSAGKSTFLNALMHRRILPSFSGETTATVNFLRHTSQAPDGVAGIVHYQDGHDEILPDLDLKTVEKVVSTKGDTEDQKIATQVSSVDLFLDSELLKDGVMLVDSPGLNGVADHHREITEQQIKCSHASIFMFNADHPGSKTDFEFLRELKSEQRSNNIFFVLNKINVIQKSEGKTVEDIVDGLKDSYHKQFPDEKELPKIWPVAGNAALIARDERETEYMGTTITTPEQRERLETISRMLPFEDRLWQYLTQGERTREQLCSPVNTAIECLKAQFNQFESQRKLLEEQTGTDELLARKTQLEANIRELKQHKESVSPEVQQQVRQKLEELRDNIHARCESTKKLVGQEMESFKKPDDLLEYSKQIPDSIRQKVYSLLSDCEDDLTGEFMEIVMHEYSKYFDELADKFNEISHQTGISLPIDEMQLPSINVASSMEQIAQECREIRAQIDELEQEYENYRMDSIKARRIEQELEKRKQEQRDLEDRLDDISHFVPRKVEHYTTTEQRKRWRGGALGIVATIIFGKEKYNVAIRREDARDHQEDTEQQEKRKQATELKKRTVEADIERITARKREESSDELREQAERAAKKQEKLLQKLQEKEEAYIKEMQTDAETACKRLTRAVSSYVGEQMRMAERKINQHLADTERAYIRAVQDIINTSLQKQLVSLQEQIDNLQQVIEKEGQEREQALLVAEQAAEQIRSLLNVGIELKTRLETQLDDHIEQEELS